MAHLRTETGQDADRRLRRPSRVRREARTLRYTSPPSLDARMSPIPIKSTRPKLKSATTTTRLADMCGDFMQFRTIAQAKIGARLLSFEIAKQSKGRGSRVESSRRRRRYPQNARDVARRRRAAIIKYQFGVSRIIAAARVDFDRSRSTC